MEQQTMELEDRQLLRRPPEGTVTIVFTDVQSSTMLWDTCPRDMKKALDIQNKLLRELIGIYQGYEVKTEGDAFMVAFSEAAHAMKWCMNVQLKLLDETWPAELAKLPEGALVKGADGNVVFNGLRVRMGFNTGEPDCGQDPMTGRMDYFGPMVNLAARIASTGKAGETIIGSAAMAALKRAKALPDPDIALTGWGTKMLKGISREETMFQLLPQCLISRKETPQTTAKPEKRPPPRWDFSLPAKSKRVRPAPNVPDDLLLRVQTRVPRVLRFYKQATNACQAVEQQCMQAEDDARVEIAPQGTVAVVYTEISKSDALATYDPEAAEEMVRAHNTLLLDAVGRFEGYVFKSHGSAMMTSFHTADAALRFCLAAQCDLLKQAWPVPFRELLDTAKVTDETGAVIFNGPRVRMGMNTGKPLRERDEGTGRFDYFGPVVNSATRLAGAAVGGEICVGEAAHESLTLSDQSQNAGPLLSAQVVLKPPPANKQGGFSPSEGIRSVVPKSLTARRKYWSELSNADRAALESTGLRHSGEVFRKCGAPPPGVASTKGPSQAQALLQMSHVKVMTQFKLMHDALRLNSSTAERIVTQFHELVPVVRYVSSVCYTLLNDHAEDCDDALKQHCFRFQSPESAQNLHRPTKPIRRRSTLKLLS
ncbi:Adenylate cyclase [Diplonema papillatum]|nr:Adenylate cyclase [Diplonema papillatum]